MGLPSALVVCLTTVRDGKKGPEGQFTVPTVCLADQETTACIIHYVYSFSLCLSDAHPNTHRVCMCVPKYEKVGNRHKTKAGKTGQYDKNVRKVCERRGKVVGDGEIQYLCNRPHAKIIQA